MTFSCVIEYGIVSFIHRHIERDKRKKAQKDPPPKISPPKLVEPKTQQSPMMYNKKLILIPKGLHKDPNPDEIKYILKKVY